jgi:hypothetical protein
MDRYEADWSMVERGWKAHVLGEAEHRFADAGAAIAALRKVRGWPGRFALAESRAGAFVWG